MSYIDDYRNRINRLGTNNRERAINVQKRSIKQSFKSNPSYYLVDVYTSSTPLSSISLDCWITDDSDVKDQKNIVAYPDQDLDKGYLIYWTDKGSYWLVVQADVNFGDVYSKGTMQKCNAIATFLTETTTYSGFDSLGRPIGTTTTDSKEYRCIATSKVRLSSETDLEVNLPDGRASISMMYDPYLTLDIKSEFGMYSKTWRIVDLDMTNVIDNSGVLVITAERSESSS